VIESEFPTPTGAVTTFAYDTNNDRTTTTYPNGVATTATYDASQRLKTLVAKKGAATLTSYSYGYTTSGGADRGLRQSETDIFGEITRFTYDTQERLTAATRTVSGTDGAFGSYAVQSSTSANRSSPVSLQGQTVSGNIYAFVNPTTSVSEVRFYVDDPGMVHAPFRTDTAAPFDLAGSSGSNAVAFDTGTLSAGPHVITAAVTLTSGKTEVASAEFAARSGSPGTAWSYAYDSRSNRSSSTIDAKLTSYAYNAANQLTSSAGVSYSYDGTGNLTGASDGLSLAYNAANQTTSITPPGGGAQSMAFGGCHQCLGDGHRPLPLRPIRRYRGPHRRQQQPVALHRRVPG
jgi:YD repeat-containing protein